MMSRGFWGIVVGGGRWLKLFFGIGVGLVTCCGSLSAADLDVLKERTGVQELVVIARHPILSSHTYTYFNEAFTPGGGLYRLGKDGFTELVNSDAGQIIDAELSYDGKRVLFSWKRDAASNYSLYLIGVDGSGLRPLTTHPSNNFNASWLPDGGIAFLSDRDNNYAYCHDSSSAVLYRMQPDGSGMKRLSANYLSDITPHVMNNGKIMFTRWEYIDRFQIPSQGVWAQNPDGTGLTHVYGGRMLDPVMISEPKPIPGTHELLTVLTGHNGGISGGVGIVDPHKGANSPDALTVILGDMVRMPSQSNRKSTQCYEYPYPVNAAYFLISNAGEILLSTYDGQQVATLLDKDEGPARGDIGFFGALPIQARQREAVIQSSLPEGAPPTATVVMQDVYIGLEEQLADGSLTRGDVKQIRVILAKGKKDIGSKRRSAFCWQFPVVSAGATMEPKQTVGTYEIEADGSAMFEVPAMAPVLFQALDAEGRTIQRMRTFGQFMPGEVQSCTGCHMDRNTAVPAANSRRILALQKAPQKLNGAPWTEHELAFSYTEQVQPIWDRHCVRCHNVIKTAGGLDLSGDRTDLFNVSYDTLVRDGVNQSPTTKRVREDLFPGIPRDQWFPHKYISYIPSHNGIEEVYMAERYFKPFSWGSYQSRLAELIRSGHPDRRGTPRVDLSDLERRVVFAWIDYNVPYYPTSHTNHPELTHGMRELVPRNYERLLNEVAERRCLDCHQTELPVRGWFSWNDRIKVSKRPTLPRKLPLKHYLRWEKPELNSFLMAPLAKEAGGSGKCGRAVFKDKSDPDYQKLLRAFDSIHDRVEKIPRMDMPGAKEVRRSGHLTLYTNCEQP